MGWISLSLCCLFIGFVWGKAVGKQLGKQLMKTALPLQIRQQSLEKGYCIFCHRVFRYQLRLLKDPARKKSY
jgi:hypothetical protein